MRWYSMALLGLAFILANAAEAQEIDWKQVDTA